MERSDLFLALWALFLFGSQLQHTQLALKNPVPVRSTRANAVALGLLPYLAILAPALLGGRRRDNERTGFKRYKKYSAIMILACVDSRGVFTYVSAGEPGSAGDAQTWNNSAMRDRIETGVWLSYGGDVMHAGETEIPPFIVADSAFGLTTRVMKCYETDHPTAQQLSFNYALIRTRLSFKYSG